MCVRIAQHYRESPARVFDAWLNPQVARLWLFATASRPMAGAIIDARAGGAFCFTERRADATLEHRGRYVEITRPQRLAFTLRSPDCAAHDTRVSVTLSLSQTGCELRLVHDGVPVEHADRMTARWIGILYGLGEVLAAGHRRNEIYC